jgi:hypothetical protein
LRLSLQPLICPADRFFGLLKLRRSDSYYRGKDVINDFSRALVLPYCDLPGYRKVGERLRASLSSQLDQLFQMPFVDQPRSFRGELSQRSFSFSILLFAFSPCSTREGQVPKLHFAQTLVSGWCLLKTLLTLGIYWQSVPALAPGFCLIQLAAATLRNWSELVSPTGKSPRRPASPPQRRRYTGVCFRPRGYALLPKGGHRTPMRRSAPKIPRRRGSTADDRSSSRRRRQ